MEHSPDKYIKIRGARTNNLKNINLDIPKNTLTVITGLSGSGKSSLAFDTIYAEGQRKYVESLSAYARQFLGLMDKPDVDIIEGLSPAISIDQKSSGHNPRSTVGTVTEVYDYLRLLYARVGHPRSPITGRRLEKQTVSQIVDSILNFNTTFKSENVKILILSPLIKNRKGTYEELFNRLLSQGYVRVRIDNKIYSLEEDIKLDKFVKHNIELVVDRLVIKSEDINEEFTKRLTDSIEQSLNLGSGEVLINIVDILDLKKDNKVDSNLKINELGDIFYSEKLVDPETGESFNEVEPHSFSFNSPFGACPVCSGLGSIKEIDESNVFNPRLTVSEGGIYPWARMVENTDSMTYKLVEAVAKEERFSLRVPIGDLMEEHKHLLLYGKKNKKYTVIYESNGAPKAWSMEYEGVIPNLLRRYKETDSEYIRSEIEQYMIEKECPECKGFRLKKDIMAVTIRGKNIVDISNMPISMCYDWINRLANNDVDNIDFKSIANLVFNFKTIESLEDELSENEHLIAKQIFKEILMRLNFLISVGLDYLTLSRSARTLSGGESQRIRLASQIGTGLTGVLYVLDEPSIGLHQRDNERLIKTLENLRDLGNSVIVVEHDEDTIKKADHIIDIGPGAGEHGGYVVAQGNLEDIKNEKKSITGKYLNKEIEITREGIDNEVSKINGIDVYNGNNKNGYKGKLIFSGVKHHNLKNVDLEIPLGKFVCVTGVSGSGKSSLINDVVYKKLSKEFYSSKDNPGEFSEMRGIENLDKVINIDQSPIGRTPRSNPATYTGIFNVIREIFAQTKESKLRGYKLGRFSFNVKGGRCEKCEGAGVIRISMQFLPDVYVTCEECHGKRYNRETLQIDYKGKNISEVLDMTVEEGVEFFKSINTINSKLQTLLDVGLGYIKLGQAATTLSGGESQRVKLASELSKRSTGKTMYILDEPTTGLHFEDVRKLLIVLHSLVNKGNTVLVIEHNLDLIKTADWIIDLGPEGGDKGGYVIALGSVNDIVNSPESYTGQWLKTVI